MAFVVVQLTVAAALWVGIGLVIAAARGERQGEQNEGDEYGATSTGRRVRLVRMDSM
ncbi:hypothetical protein [Persicimonas caeni]|uniref:hypothetical protein n=1 Tax=Persicimonas caeni TaxID=2292766 RepID=UPI00143D74E8|nr:hypothetical protein [Persicimonas caeni]